MTLRSSFRPLRSQVVFPTLRIALSRANRREPLRFRVVHFSVQRDHVHLIVEASDERALSAGVRSVAIRMARYVNDLVSRRGRFWADRWFGRELTSPRQVRNALVYVLANFRKHARCLLQLGLDPYSSAERFDGFREWQPGSAPPWIGRGPPPFASTSEGAEVRAWLVRPGRTWLVRVGWRRSGLVALGEGPCRDMPS